MARGITKRADEAAVDLTPMLDVVFILLIFFIVTSTFIQERAIGMEPPPPPGPSSPTNDPAMILYLDANNSIRQNGRLIDASAIAAGLQRLRAENPDSALIIQASAQASTGVVIGLRDIAYKAEIERVNVVRSE